MGKYHEICETCEDETITHGWVPDKCPFCELAEALEELKKANQYIANVRSWNVPDSLLAEMSMIKQQRDTLAEAVSDMMQLPSSEAYKRGKQALAAVKGGDA
jgi:hypothetical protein